MGLISHRSRVLRALCLPLLTLSGCQAIRHRNDVPKAPVSAITPSDPTDTKADKARLAHTDFDAKVTKSQAFSTHIAMGKNAASGGDYQLAVNEFQKAIDVSTQSKGHRVDAHSRAEAHRQLAKSFDHQGRFVEAEEQYHKAQKLAPNDPKVWNDLGYSYYLQRRYDLAEKNLTKALKLEKNSAGINTNLGLTLAAAGKTDEALSVLSRMEGPAVGHANLGYMLAALGKNDEARAHYQKAMDLQPNLMIARTALARLDRPAAPTKPITSVAQNATRPLADPALQRTSATQAIPQSPIARATAHPASSTLDSLPPLPPGN